MKILGKTIFLLSILFCFSSCEKYLDEKPDKKQVIPLSVGDCQAMLNNVELLSGRYPSAAEGSTDDYTLTFPVWSARQPWEREIYLWQSDANASIGDWSAPYNNILVANQVLETLGKITPTAGEQAQWNKIRGAALLLRSMFFHILSQMFAKQYDPATAGQDLGIPLRLTPSLSEVTVRSTLQETYDRITTDLNEAIALLPAEQPTTTLSKSIAMPVKAAALAALARVYLTMGDYAKAFTNADASLQQYNVLLDYATLSPASNFPVEEYNPEVLYSLHGNGNTPLFFGRVMQALYDMYQPGDRRKTVCFRQRETGTYTHKATYIPGSLFGGLATDEVYLIRAECAARAGDATLAIADLNTLLRKRWDNTFIPYTTMNADTALNLVLIERRKELPYRGLRWSDLRRLNKETRFATTLTRVHNGQVYTLPPNDPRYTLLIPREVLQRVSLPQNPR